MKLLVTAGNTLAPIDRVRAITNIFTGRTGARIALEAHHRGHGVTLVTSHPDAVISLAATPPTTCSPYWQLVPYRTFDELRVWMTTFIQGGRLDAVIHCAAVSDYQAAGIFAPAPGTRFDPDRASWHGEPPALVDRAAGKVKSDEPELWLRLVRTPKLIDLVRREWGFRGVLVKFKLEVGVADDDLLAIAERSRRQSDADWMVANTLEGAAAWAYIGSAAGYKCVERSELAARLLDAVEGQLQERSHA
jgi:phosphopantothenate-cysteine ligase/phosphopantothenoylcysteine decarboxylase/phosphopantothenate--cysteine ligase